MAHIVLIFPPSVYRNHTPPLNMAYLASALERAGHRVTVFDFSALNSPFSEDHVFQFIREERPLWIGLTLNVIFIRPAYDLIGRLKTLGIPIIAGGPHPSLLAEECLENGCDIVVRGEGEETVIDLTDTLLSPGNLHEVAGISWLENGQTIHNPNRPLIADLDALPFPAKHLFPKSWYTVDSEDYQVYGPVFSGRGCPANCHYCYKGVFGHGCRSRSAGNVIREMVHLKKEFGVTAFEFMDDAFSADLDRVKAICNMILKEPDLQNIRWQCTTRLDLTSRDLLHLMKESGCFRIFYGLESGDPDTLDRVNKHLDLNQAVQVLKWTRDSGIRSIAGFMWGFPWDSPASVKASLRLLRNIAPYTDEFNPLGILIPVPGTRVYQDFKDRFGFENWWLKDKFGYRYRSNTYFPFFQRSFYNDFSLLDDGFFRFPPGVRHLIRRGTRMIGRHNLFHNAPFTTAVARYLAATASELLYRINPLAEQFVFDRLSRWKHRDGSQPS